MWSKYNLVISSAATYRYMQLLVLSGSYNSKIQKAAGNLQIRISVAIEAADNLIYKSLLALSAADNWQIQIAAGSFRNWQLTDKSSCYAGSFSSGQLTDKSSCWLFHQRTTYRYKQLLTLSAADNLQIQTAANMRTLSSGGSHSGNSSFTEY